MPTYKLRSGVHSEFGKVYKRGDIFQSNCDLLKLNHPPTSIKFEKLSDDDVELPTKDQKEEAKQPEPEEESSPGIDCGYSKEELEDLKVKEIEGIAEELGVDLSQVSKSPRYRKQEIIQLLLGE